MDNLVGRIHRLMDQNNIPIVGVRQAKDGTISLDFDQSATADQKAQAATLLANQDKTPKRRRGRNAIYGDLAKLKQADLNNLLLHALADWVADNPQVVASMNLGISGDEPDV